MKIIFELIAQNQTDDAIKRLMALCESRKDLQESIIIISAQYQEYKKQTIEGVINLNEGSIMLSKINKGLIQIINSLSKVDVQEKKLKTSNENNLENKPKIEVNNYGDVEKQVNNPNIDGDFRM